MVYILQDGRVNCRVRVTGVYNGKPFVYEEPVRSHSHGSQYIWPDGDPSTFWWSEGNMGCDCNRGEFVGEELDCGHEVKIDTIECLDYDGPTLVLNESKERTDG